MLGRGGAASVFEARQLSTGQRVALKVFHDSPFLQELASAEIRALAVLTDQPNVLRLLDAPVSVSGDRALAVEMIDAAVDAGHKAKQRPFSTSEALDIAITIGTVLDRLHARGFIHGDVKPSNILLTDAGPKLIDFGLARPIGIADEPVESLGLTLPWGAPESYNSVSEPNRISSAAQSVRPGVTVRADVYSLALTLLTLVTGETPRWSDSAALRSVEGRESPADIVRGVFSGFDEALLPELRSRIGSELLKVIGRAASFDPGERPATMEQFVNELRELRVSIGNRNLASRLPPPAGDGRDDSREWMSVPPLSPAEFIGPITSYVGGGTSLNAAIHGAATFGPIAARFDRFVRERSEEAERRSRKSAQPNGSTKAHSVDEAPGSKRDPLVLAVLTALPLENAAVIRCLKNRKVVVGPLGTRYVFGTFGASGHEWVVACTCVGAGNLATALVAQQTAIWLKPDLVGFVGVAGGLKDVVIGDVVVASKVIGYESAKVGSQLLPRPDVRNVAAPLVQHFVGVGGGRKWRQRLPLDRRVKDYAVLVKPIAAGEKILSSTRASVAKAIRKFHSDAVAVEMEGLGLLVAADHGVDVPAIVVRGISDLLDDKDQANDDDNQPLAAATAAALFFEGVSTLERAQLRAETVRDPSAQAVVDDLTIYFAEPSSTAIEQ